MGIQMNYFPDVKALVTRASDNIGLNEWLAHHHNVESALCSKDVQIRIMDIRGLKQSGLGTVDIYDLAQLNRRVIDAYPVKAMLVLALEDLQYGLCRMWEGFAGLDDGQLHIFRSCMDACKWLRDTFSIQECLLRPQRA